MIGRACVALAGACLAWAAYAQAPMPGAWAPDLTALVARADAALAAGDAAAATGAYEQATLLRHDASIETGWLRAQMQSGEYRRALAFAAHVAGAHRDAASGAALYAWLLHVGAQGAAARTQAATALQRWPDDAHVRWVHAALDAGPPRTEAPLRLGPHASGARVPEAARVVGSGMLVAAQRALVPAVAVAGAASLWVRDGLGRARGATLESIDAELRIAVLVLDDPLDVPRFAAGPSAFPGSAAFALGYAIGADTAAWPSMNLGFLATPTASGHRPLDLPVASSGGPVFDHHARVVGMAVADRFVPWSLLKRWVEPAPATVTPLTTPDAIYETALPLTLQLIRETTPDRPSPG